MLLRGGSPTQGGSARCGFLCPGGQGYQPAGQRLPAPGRAARTVNGGKPSRLIRAAISCFARPKARYTVFAFPQARANPPALAAPIGFRRDRLRPRVGGASGKSPRTKLGSGTGERAACNVPSRRHERGEKQQRRPGGAGGGRRSRGLPAAPPRHPPLPEAPAPAPPSAPGSAGSQGSAPGRAGFRPGSFSALHATRSPSVPFPPVPRTPQCESAGRCGEDGDGPVSRQGRLKHSGDVPEAGTWVSPRPAAPARMNAPGHGLFLRPWASPWVRPRQGCRCCSKPVGCSCGSAGAPVAKQGAGGPGSHRPRNCVGKGFKPRPRVSAHGLRGGFSGEWSPFARQFPGDLAGPRRAAYRWSHRKKKRLRNFQQRRCLKLTDRRLPKMPPFANP